MRASTLLSLVLVLAAATSASAFQGQPFSRGRSRSAASSSSSSSLAPLAAATATAEDLSGPELVSRAKAIVEANMGLRNPGAFSADFTLYQSFREPLDKAKYIAQYGAAQLEVAFPDLYLNGYDFRADPFDQGRVWATVRPTGTHRGAFKAEGKVLEPTLRKLDSAPECILFDFDTSSGLCTAMTTGFCMDRSVGNTGPVGGIWGALNAVGEPVPAWKYRPPANVVSDVISRNFRYGQSPLKQSPLPAKLMIGIAKTLSLTLLESPADALDLLSEDFEFSTALAGPDRKASLASMESLKSLCPSYKETAYDFRVDPYEPARVWWTYRGSGKTEDGKAFSIAPQAASATFDSLGFVSKITRDYVMDPVGGDNAGLGGRFGLLQAMGKPASDALTRPAPESLIRAMMPKASASPAAASKKASPAPAAAAPAKQTPKASVNAPVKGSAAPKVPPAKPMPTKKATGAPVPVKAPPASKAPTVKPVFSKPTASKTTPAAAKQAATPLKKQQPPTKPAAETKKTTSATKAAASSPFASVFGAFTPKPSSTPSKDAANTESTDKKEPKAAAAPKNIFATLSISPKAAEGTKEPEKQVKSAKENKEAASAPKNQSVAAAAPVSPVQPVKKEAAKPAPASVTFDGKLREEIASKIGAGKVGSFETRTNTFLRGGINAQNYYKTVKDLGLQSLAQSILAALPEGAQKKSLANLLK